MKRSIGRFRGDAARRGHRRMIPSVPMETKSASSQTARSRIIRLLSDGRIMRARDLRRDAACDGTAIARLVEDGSIHRYGGGYRMSNPSAVLPDEMLASVALRFPRGVLALMGAARHWGLTDIPSGSADPTVYVSRGTPFSNTIGVRVVRKSDPATLEIGVSTVPVFPGRDARVTDPSRTVADLFACGGNTVERGAAQEALAILMRDRGRDAASLAVEYARMLGRTEGTLEIAVEAMEEALTWNAMR